MFNTYLKQKKDTESDIISDWALLSMFLHRKETGSAKKGGCKASGSSEI